MAGIISVPKSMQRMRTALNANGILAITKSTKGASSALLDDNVYAIDFFKLSKIIRPIVKISK